MPKDSKTSKFIDERNDQYKINKLGETISSFRQAASSATYNFSKYAKDLFSALSNLNQDNDDLEEIARNSESFEEITLNELSNTNSLLQNNLEVQMDTLKVIQDLNKFSNYNLPGGKNFSGGLLAGGLGLAAMGGLAAASTGGLSAFDSTTSANPAAAISSPGARGYTSPYTSSSGGITSYTPSKGYGKNYPISKADVEAIIRKEAAARGIDPDVAVRVFRSEGAGSYQSSVPRSGRGSYMGREASFGPYQLYLEGLGKDYQEKTGRNLLEDNTVEGITNQIRFALDQAASGGRGWKPWYGAAKVGVSQFQGLSGAQSLENWQGGQNYSAVENFNEYYNLSGNQASAVDNGITRSSGSSNNQEYAFVSQEQFNQARVRNQSISETLARQLELGGAASGLKVEVFSGGQMSAEEARRLGASVRKNSKGQKEYILNGKVVALGSIRHGDQHGHGGEAADIRFYDAKTGNRVFGNTPEEIAKIEKFVETQSRLGSRGIGFGEGYMGPGVFHIDSSDNIAKQSAGHSPTWGGGMGEGSVYREAMRRGAANPLDLNQAWEGYSGSRPQRENAKRVPAARSSVRSSEKKIIIVASVHTKEDPERLFKLAAQKVGEENVIAIPIANYGASNYNRFTKAAQNAGVQIEELDPSAFPGKAIHPHGYNNKSFVAWRDFIQNELKSKHNITGDTEIFVEGASNAYGISKALGMEGFNVSKKKVQTKTYSEMERALESWNLPDYVAPVQELNQDPRSAAPSAMPFEDISTDMYYPSKYETEETKQMIGGIYQYTSSPEGTYSAIERKLQDLERRKKYENESPWMEIFNNQKPGSTPLKLYKETFIENEQLGSEQSDNSLDKTSNPVTSPAEIV